MLNHIIVGIIICFAVISGGLFISILHNMQEESYLADESFNSHKKEEYNIWIPSSIDEQMVKSMYTSYDEKRLGVKFKITTLSSEIYHEALINGGITNKLPDMFYIDDMRCLTKLVDIGSVMDLSEYIISNGFEKNFVEGAIEDFTINNRIYGLPLRGDEIVLYCNIAIFEACHVAYPTSYDELVESIKAFKEQGVVPLSLGGESFEGIERYYRMLVEGNKSIKESAKALEELIQLTPFHKAYCVMTEEDAVNCFINGESAMFLGTSQEATLLEQAKESKIKEQIKVISCPTICEENIRIGSYTSGFVLNQNSTLNKEDKIKAYYENFERNLSWEMVIYRGKGLPVYKSQLQEKTRFKLLNTCNEMMLTSTQKGVYDDLLKVLDNKGLSDQYKKQALSLARGQIDAESFLEILGL